MKNSAYYLVNFITGYRVFAFVLLVIMLYFGYIEAFRWLLAISFFTDLIDGFLARRLKVQSAFGARLDSVGDDLTVLAGLIGLWIFHKDFLTEQIGILSGLVVMFFVQTIIALLRYRKTTSFHTYLAKVAAIFQGTFLILMFFLNEPPYLLFYAAALITFFELAEEIIITLILPEWRTDIKGLYWVMRYLQKEKKSIRSKEED